MTFISTSRFFFGGGGGGRGEGGGRVLRFPGLVEHSPEFAEIICSLAYCVCEKGCSCNVPVDRNFKEIWKRWRIYFCHPRSSLLGVPLPPSLSNRICHAGYPWHGPNPAARSHSGSEKFARAMKGSKSRRINQFAPEKGYRIWRCSNVTLIYILSDENLKHVLRITSSVFERHESLLLTPRHFQTDMLYRKYIISMAPRHRMQFSLFPRIRD